MKTTVQARLDPDSQKALQSLTRRLGLSPSEVVRASLLAMANDQTPKKVRSIIGAGQFDSGIPDLSTNKKYMEDFGMTRQQRLQLAKSRQTK